MSVPELLGGLTRSGVVIHVKSSLDLGQHTPGLLYYSLVGAQ